MIGGTASHTPSATATGNAPSLTMALNRQAGLKK